MTTRSVTSRGGAASLSRNANNNKNSGNLKLSLDKLSDESRALYTLITSKFESALADLQAKLAVKEAKVDQLDKLVSDLRIYNTELSDRVDELETRERGSSLIISGKNVPLAVDRENVSGVAAETIRNMLRCEVKQSDLIEAYRVGKKPATQKPDRRSLIIKFQRRDLRDDVLRSARTVKPTGIYVNDNLTPLRSDILFKLRQVRKLHPNKIDGCGSSAGRVFVWLKFDGSPNKKFFVNTTAKLDDLLEKDVGISSGSSADSSKSA